MSRRFADLGNATLAKKLSNQQLIGKRGALLFGELVMAQGFSFHETTALDTGIDGFIELRDPQTREVMAQYIACQIKTREHGTFLEETDESFSFICEQRDLDYWMSSNAPVILIAVRLSDRQVYWKSIQSWFENPERRRSRKVVFHKQADRLDGISVPQFGAVVAGFGRPGLMVASVRADEQLDVNLLKVVYPEKVHVAETGLSYKEIRQTLVDQHDNPPSDWILVGKRIWSFRDLSLPPFRDVTEEGSAEFLATREWYQSNGDVTRNQFADLLRRTLEEMLHDPLIYWRSRGYFFFKKLRDQRRRRHNYKSFQNKTSRDVVKGYGKPGDPPAYYRHAAFFASFVELGEEWYVGINPTYHFTSDGYHDYRYAADRLSGIKRLETNQSVRGQVGMWKAFLVRDPDLLRKDPLRFEDVEPATVGFAIVDDLWRGNEDDEEKQRLESAQNELFS
jgi:hypothetical protein